MPEGVLLSGHAQIKQKNCEVQEVEGKIRELRMELVDAVLQSNDCRDALVRKIDELTEQKIYDDEAITKLTQGLVEMAASKRKVEEECQKLEMTNKTIETQCKAAEKRASFIEKELKMSSREPNYINTTAAGKEPTRAQPRARGPAHAASSAGTSSRPSGRNASSTTVAIGGSR